MSARSRAEVEAAIAAMTLSAEGDPALLPDATIITLQEVAARRMAQIGIHGFDAAHDDRHLPDEFADLCRDWIDKADETVEFRSRAAPQKWRDLMLDVAALAVAAVESYDRQRLPQCAADAEGPAR